MLFNTFAFGQANFSGGGNGTEDDPYVILNADDWDAFAESVVGNYDYAGKFVRIDNNINVMTMAGEFTGELFSTVKPFRGTFDGNWNTLTLQLDAEKEYAAPFVIVDGATIKNLSVDGTIKTAEKDRHAAGIVSCVENSATRTNIINCTQAHMAIDHDKTTVFGTFHLPSDLEPLTGWESAYYTRRINNGDEQGTPAFVSEKEIPSGFILKRYERDYTDKEFFVPGAVVDLNAIDIYTLPIRPTVTYYGKTMVEDTDYTVETIGENGVYDVTISAKSHEYAGSTTVQGITVAEMASWGDLKTLLANGTVTRNITLNTDYSDKESEGALTVNGTVVLNLNGHTIDRGLQDSDYMSEGYVLLVERNANLTINGSGTITGGKTRGNGGGICLYQGTLSLQDCTIRGNVSDNTGGIFVNNGRTLIVQGYVYICDNIGDSQKMNVFLEGTKDKITVSGPLDKNTLIGVSRNSSGDITSGLKGNDWGDEDNFRSDNDDYYWLIKSEKQEVQLSTSLHWNKQNEWNGAIYEEEDV